MKWAEMSTEEKDRLIHEKVMGIDPHTPCADTAHYHEEAHYWHCSGCDKHWLQQPEEPHAKEIPPYTTDMNTAWLVVKRVNKSDSPDYPDYGTYARFIDALQKIVGSDLFFDLFYCDDEGDHLSPERICLAALKACGIEIE